MRALPAESNTVVSVTACSFSVCAHFVCRRCSRCSCCSRQKKVDGPTKVCKQEQKVQTATSTRRERDHAIILGLKLTYQPCLGYSPRNAAIGLSPFTPALASTRGRRLREGSSCSLPPAPVYSFPLCVKQFKTIKTTTCKTNVRKQPRPQNKYKTVQRNNRYQTR